MAQDDYERERGEGPAVLTLFGTLFLASVDNQLLIPLLPTLGRDFAVPLQKLGLLFSAYALSAGLFNLVLGPLTDRYGRTIFLQLGLPVFALLALTAALVPGYGSLLMIRSATGVTAGLLSTCTAGFIGDHFSYRRRGRVMGIVLSSYFAALILGIPIGAWLAEAFGWRSVFWLSTATAALLTAAAWTTLPRGRKAAPDFRTRQPGLWKKYRAIHGKRGAFAALGVSFLVSGGTLVFLTYISGHLNEGLGFGPVQISTVFVVGGVAALCASPFSGWLSDRWTKRGTFLAANLSLLLPLVLLPYLPWGILFFSALFVISLAIAFRQTALQTLQTELVDESERGAFLALRNCASQLGISASVFVGGLLYAAYGYVAVTGLAALLTLLGTVIFFFNVPEPAAE